MHSNYPRWLAEQGCVDKTQSTKISQVKKIEENYGDLEKHFTDGTYEDVISSLQYSTDDERANRPNPSKINFNGNIRNNLQSYKNAARSYREFLTKSRFQNSSSEKRVFTEDLDQSFSPDESKQQRLSLERDMQFALRRNIASLDSTLKIIDNDAERAVDSGFIDITCEDDDAFVVIELKAGKADSRAIAQILGYMGDLQEEEDGKAVRGILVAHDFDKRAKAAARVIPTLTLKKYSVEFRFMPED